MPESQIVAGVEVGTSKIQVLIGEITNRETLNIIGKATTPSEGVRKGEILDFKAASRCTHKAISEAEKSAGVKVDGVFISQTGRHLQADFNVGSTLVKAQDSRVSQKDIEKAVDDAKGKELPEGRLYIHHVQNPFLLDGHSVDEPLSFQGNRLEVGYLSIHGNEKIIRDHIHLINGYSLDVRDMIVSSIAAGAAIVNDSEKKAGVLVIDIGSGTTDYVLYRNGYVVKTGVVPVGGDHLTNDLSMGLRVSREHAEEFKLKEGKAVVDPTDAMDEVWSVGDHNIGDRSVKKSSIYKILNLRVEELFSIIHKELGTMLHPQHVAAGVLLTGGTSRLPEIERVAAEQLGLKAQKAWSEAGIGGDLKDPETSVVVGLLHYALTADSNESSGDSTRGLFSKVAKIFNIG